MKGISKQVRDVPFSGIRKFFELVQKSKDVVSLGVGEPDFPTPDVVKDMGIRAIEEDYTSYTSNYGLIELREEVSKKLKNKNGIEADPESEVLITSGTSEALDLAFRAILNPGDEVIIPEPSYVAYGPDIWFSYGKPVSVPTFEKDEFRINAKDIKRRITKKTKAILVASPNNPTGSVLGKECLEDIAKIAIEHDLFVISDEIYENLIYDGLKHYSIGSFKGMEDRVITINGVSKAYAMTGWRIGYASGNETVIEAMMKIHQYSMLCAPSISQYAAISAITNEDLAKEMVREYDRRRRLLVGGLNDISGISCIMPKGAFYVFANIKKTGMGSEEFAGALLNEAGVAVVPGNTFGASGEGYVRCSYSVGRDDIREALARIKKFSSRL